MQSHSTPSVIANFQSVVSLFLDIQERSVCADEDGNARVSVQRLTENAVRDSPIWTSGGIRAETYGYEVKNG